MMKSMIAPLLCFLLIGTGISQADDILMHEPSQPPQAETLQNKRVYGQIFILKKAVICNDSKVIYNLAKNKSNPEFPIFFGIIKNIHGVATVMTQIFISKNNKSFSVIESNNVGISCIISFGGEYDLMPHYHKGDVQKGRLREANKLKRPLFEKIRTQD